MTRQPTQATPAPAHACSHFILFVADQQRSKAFFQAVLGQPPLLDLPGMTQFALGPGCLLGLMPLATAARLFDRQLESVPSFPRNECYLERADAQACLQRARDAGACCLSPFQARNWGHWAGYILDPDGHLIAFATNQAPAKDPSAEEGSTSTKEAGS
jgi:catechol 2,3-dioxygenase-like lactoylglutathione lyase family enzyme